MHWPSLLFVLSALTNGYVNAEPSASVFLADSSSGNGIQYLIIEEADVETVNVICHVKDLEPNHVVSITRETRTGSSPESLVWNNNATSSANTEHITFDGFINIGGSSYLYTLIVRDVTRHDAGNYNCEIFTQSGNRFTPVTNGSAGLRVLYLPDAIYPICDVLSANRSYVRYAGDEVTFRCESERGDPDVFLDWMLSPGRGPSIPRAKEGISNGIAYSEIVITLEEGHNGKQFDCQLGTGLQITYKPKCAIGPYIIQPKPTTPKPPTTLPQITTKSRTTLAKSTQPSDVTQPRTKTPPVVSVPSGLNSAAIAGICVIIALSIGIVILIVVAWLIRSKRCLSFNVDTYIEKSPLDDTQRPPSAIGGIGNLGTSLTLMMASERLEDPELLGFKRRVSKKASLRSDDDLDGEPYGFENGHLALDFDTINEHEDSTPSSPTPNAHDYSTKESPSNIVATSEDCDSPTSPKDSQPFLSTTQPNDGYNDDDGLKHSEEPSEPSPDSTGGADTVSSAPQMVLPDEPSSSSHNSIEELEGSFVDESDSEDVLSPGHAEQDADPDKPRDLPQDVMDILMELDLDLFANEEDQDTNF